MSAQLVMIYLFNTLKAKLVNNCIFPQKMGFDISCKLSQETIVGNVKAYYLGKIRKMKNVSKCHLLKFFLTMLCVKTSRARLIFVEK